LRLQEEGTENNRLNPHWAMNNEIRARIKQEIS